MRSKKAIKNIIISLLSQLVVVICGFIIPRMIIQNFGSSVNGLISSITQFLGYITLLESGIGPVIKAALYKPIAMKDNKQIANILRASEKFFKKIAYIFLIYLVVLCIVYPLFINNEFDAYFTISLIVIIAIATFAEYFLGLTYSLFLQAQQKLYIMSWLKIFSTIINAILIVILIKFGANIQTVKLVSAFIFVLKPILQSLYVKKKYNINLKEADDNYKLKQKWDGLAQHIASVVHTNTDVAVLTLLSTLKEVSVYTVYLAVIKGVKNLIISLINGIDASFGDMIAKEEKEILNKSFKIYETLYFTIITIVFTSTIILIVPFINVYTKGIIDVNYSRPLFATVMVLAEFIDCIRLPYGALISAAGHFKQTRIGAWIEAGTNIILSVILVYNFGIVGVAIGTLVAITIRTIEFIIYTSKNILERDVLKSFKWIALITIQVLLVCFINYILLNNLIVTSYIDWFLYAIIIGLLSIIVIIGINFMINKNDIKSIIKLIK